MSEQNKVELYARDARFERARLGFLDHRIVDLSDSYEILEPDEPLDLRAYGRILRKRLPTILIVFFLVFTVGLIATLKEKPIYRAQVLLEIQKENPDIPTIKDLYELESVSDSYLKTQYSILASESVARQVIDQLHLDTLPEFNRPKWWQLGKRLSLPRKQTFALDPVRPGQDPEVYQRVLERFQGRLTIDPVSRSRLVNVRFDSNDAQLSARIAQVEEQPDDLRARCAMEGNAKGDGLAFSTVGWRQGEARKVRRAVAGLCATERAGLSGNG